LEIDRSLHILMLAPTSFFGDYGCHVRIAEEARYLQGRGHRVTICTYRNGRDLPELDIRRTASLPWRGDYEVGSSRHKLALDVLLALCALSLRKLRPDVLHCHLHEGALIGAALSRLWRVPYLFDFQGSMTAEMLDHHFLRANSLMARLTLRAERFIDRLAPRILTSTAQANELLVERFGCAPECIVHAPDCVNTDTFRPATRDASWQAARDRWGIAPGRTVLVYLGLLADYQGTDHLLQAMGRLVAAGHDVHLLLGGYPHIEQYRQLAHSLGIAERVTLAGRIRYEEAPAFLGLGDIAMAPKLSTTEGAGKILNYMGVGLPVVAYDTCASREYLGAWGVYAERGNVEALTACIADLLNDPARRQNTGAGLRRRAIEQFNWERTGQTILDTYAALLNTRR
jgi:glycosyltransferase involved in cell wall biosynthesis